MNEMFKYKTASCGQPAGISTANTPMKGEYSTGAPQANRRTVESSYTAVIPGGICAKVGPQNVVSRAPAQTDPGSWTEPRVGGPVMPNVSESEGEGEARLRLAAISAWAQHAENGECPIHVALSAITELVGAAEQFLAHPEAA